MAAPEEVAQFMLQYMRDYGYSTPYRQVLYAVRAQFGEEWIVPGRRGRDNLSPLVTKAFRDVNNGEFEWQAPRQRWRLVEDN